ncbi:MAG: hypothetical protein OEY81_06285 [Candidatus Bathyarchaeota archaeon]|nr:hypothetical protein [Candidatus Bathyarchaeota archaeon]
MLKCVVVFLLTGNGERVGHIKVRPNFVHMAVGSVFAAAIILSHFQLVQILDISALVAISFFNLLFVFLLFPLEGTLLRKIVLLFAGNSVGLLWYLIQLSLKEVSMFFLSTDAFKIITILAKPLIDFVWIVSIWSLSLSVLASAKRKTEGLEQS